MMPSTLKICICFLASGLNVFMKVRTDYVVIWKMIVLFSETDIKCSWSMFQEE